MPLSHCPFVFCLSRRTAALLLMGAALAFPSRCPAQAQQPAESAAPGSIDLPQPLPPSVPRARIVETLPASRFYFNPVPIRSHVGMRVTIGGGAMFTQGAPASAPGGVLHIDAGIVSRIIRSRTSRPLGRLWQSAIWQSIGYAYSYSAAAGEDAAARHFFAGGLGIGVHKASEPTGTQTSRRGGDSASVALGWTPSILLGRTQGSFAIGARSTFSIELYRHIVGLHLSYEFIHVWNGAFLHDGNLSLSFDPFGFLRY